MHRPLWLRSFRDALPLLASCCLLVAGFIWLRLWIAAQIDFAEAANMFTKIMPDFFERLLPVPIDTLVSVEGRVAFGFEELPALLLLALWTVARGTECLAGRLGDGTMEMLLAQPVRRLTLITSHTSVTLFGTALVTLAAWLGTAAGIATLDFNEPTHAVTYLTAASNYFSLGIFLIGAATLASAVARSRAQAVGIFVAFYVVEFTCKIFSLMMPERPWLKQLTFLTAYDPTFLTVGVEKEPAEHWPLLWQCNGILLALGLLGLAISATIFCRRDVPAPI